MNKSYKKTYQALTSRRKGKDAEERFAGLISILGGYPIKIKDGGFQTKDKKFIRTGQVCDFIVCYKSNLYLFDVKDHKGKVTRSKFIHGSDNRDKWTSTQKQFDHFSNLYNMDFKQTGFIFFEFDFELKKSFKLLSTHQILSGNFEPRPFQDPLSANYID